MIRSRPLVTVLMPVYNGAQYLETCLASMWEQSFKDFEFLVVDDGSTDDTPRILAAVRDRRLRWIRKARVGLTRALNIGLEQATCLAYVARQDVDDVSRRDRLEEQVAFLEAHPQVTLVGSGVTFMNKNGTPIGNYLCPPQHAEIVQRLYHLYNPLPHTTIMFRRQSVMECGGYREAIPKSQDYDLYLRLSESYRLASIMKPLCRATISMDSDSLEDGNGDQFRDAVLAFVSSLSRRERGVDPLEAEFCDEFVAEFRSWYATSRYPAVFRASGLRRQARLARSERRLAHALRCAIAAVRTYPEWLLLKLKLLPADREVLEASTWLHGVSKGLLPGSGDSRGKRMASTSI